MSPSTLRRTLAAGALFCSAATTWAQATPADAPWSVTLGLGLRHGPDYMGSADSSVRAVPILLASWRTGVGRFSFGDVPAMPGPFFAYTPFENDTWSLGVGVGRDTGRDDEDGDSFTSGSDHLAGMGDVDSTPVFGVYATYRIERWRVSAMARQAFDRDEGHGGRIGDLRLSYELPMPARWSVDLGVAATLADSRYMNTMFGVSTAQSAASGFDAYRAGSGLRDLALNLGARYQIDPHVVLIGRASLSQLAGDAKDSPIVERATQATLFGGVAYRW